MTEDEEQALLSFLTSARDIATMDMLYRDHIRALRFIGMSCLAVSRALESNRRDADAVLVLNEQATWLDRQGMELQAELFGPSDDKR